MTAHTKTSEANNGDDGDDDDDDDASPVEQIMRTSNASGSYEDVVLRPKVEHSNRRLVRSLAVLSSLFKSHRVSGANQEENASENLQKSLLLIPSGVVVDKQKTIQKKPKKINWNIFKTKKKHRDDTPPTFQHFAEPLNIERVSLPIDNDAEWYDLNLSCMSLYEAKVSNIVNEFNNGNQIICDSKLESMYHYDLGRHLTISTNILWSHNLSMSCQSNVNLLGANINRDQIHSDIFIEDEHHNGNGDVSAFYERRHSIDSVDSDGYAIMQPIFPTKKMFPIEQPISIDDIMTGTRYNSVNSDVSSNLSSGFGSDSDECSNSSSSSSSPQKSITYVASPATSDFSEVFPSPTTSATIPTTPLTTKKKKCRFGSKNLLGMLYAKHTPSLSNVTQTPPNKSSPECMKKVHKGTPFRVRRSKKEETNVRVKPLLPSFRI